MKEYNFKTPKGQEIKVTFGYRNGLSDFNEKFSRDCSFWACFYDMFVSGVEYDCWESNGTFERKVSKALTNKEASEVKKQYFAYLKEEGYKMIK